MKTVRSKRSINGVESLLPLENAWFLNYDRPGDFIIGHVFDFMNEGDQVIFEIDATTPSHSAETAFTSTPPTTETAFTSTPSTTTGTTGTLPHPSYHSSSPHPGAGSHCCSRKTVGQETYQLIEQDSSATQEAGCKDDCIYKR